MKDTLKRFALVLITAGLAIALPVLLNAIGKNYSWLTDKPEGQFALAVMTLFVSILATLPILSKVLFND